MKGLPYWALCKGGAEWSSYKDSFPPSILSRSLSSSEEDGGGDAFY